jgi:hypothetical protein
LNRTSSRSTSVDAFLEASRFAPVRSAATAPPGRLIFALDATMSRQPTWDMAISLQSRMFDTAQRLGGLEVQLVYFRGLSECRASPFVSGGAGLGRYMSKITVQGGNTQIGRVLTHSRDEAARARVGALVYVGDCMEERIDGLCAKAGELALLGVKAFMFHEGRDPVAGRAFKEIARLTGGAYAVFDVSAPDRLGELLSAAAAYAAGGAPALEAHSKGGGASAKLLLSQIR